MSPGRGSRTSGGSRTRRDGSPDARAASRRRSSGSSSATATSSRAKSGKQTRPTHAKGSADPQPSRPVRSGPPETGVQKSKPSAGTGQAKARAKARKAKAPKPVRTPLRERILVRLTSVDLRPRTLAAKVPFVVLVIGALGFGLGMTLWLSTHSAERSYELGNSRAMNRALAQQKEALERDVLEAQAAPALAEAARELGMIPSRDTARLIRDSEGNWSVVGQPKPAEGAPPPPLNAPLPDPTPPAPSADELEVMVRVPQPSQGTLLNPTDPRTLLRTPYGGNALLPLTDNARVPVPGNVGVPLTDNARVPSYGGIPFPGNAGIPLPSNAGIPLPSTAGIPLPGDGGVPLPGDTRIPQPTRVGVPLTDNGYVPSGPSASLPPSQPEGPGFADPALSIPGPST